MPNQDAVAEMSKIREEAKATIARLDELEKKATAVSEQLQLHDEQGDYRGQLRLWDLWVDRTKRTVTDQDRYLVIVAFDFIDGQWKALARIWGGCDSVCWYLPATIEEKWELLYRYSDSPRAIKAVAA